MPDRKDRLKANPLALQNMVDTAIGDAEQEVVEREVVVYQDNPNAITRHDDGTMTYKRFTMTAVGLVVPDDVTGEEWQDIGSVIKALESSISWVIGDWAEYANRVWKVSYAAMAEHYGYEEETLWTYASVCRSVPTLIRNQGSYFGHGRLVAPLSAHPTLQAAWLEYAAFHRLRVKDLKDDMALLAIKPVDEAIARLHMSMVENKRLGLYEDFTPRLKSNNKPSPERKKFISYRTFVDTEIDKLPYMDRQSREAFIERTTWLTNYYATLTEQAKKGE